MEPFNLKETRRRDFEISPAKYISRTIVLARVITNMRIYLFFSTTKIIYQNFNQYYTSYRKYQIYLNRMYYDTKCI